ncbi:hypothetical protein FXB39_13180 [Nocardioides sp. BGMRC 2183]|nr:hypothetical protein FXB39_13180 [Nocardioides sp. BGMRC 2183]
MSSPIIQVHVPTTPTVPAPRIALAERRPLVGPIRIGLIDNGKPCAKELLLLVADRIAERVAEVQVHLISKPSAANPITEDEAAEMASRTDLVVTGLGDCGACTACSVQDALLMERAGTPATVLVTEVFVPTVARFADVLGAPGYHHLAVPHPVATKPTEELERLSGLVLEAALDQLGSREAASVG